MSHIFISHASADDSFVQALRLALEAHNLPVWVDSRHLRGGSKLGAEIEAAITTARQVIAVLSVQTVNSPWVRREINYAIQVEQTRGADGYRIIPLLLPGMKPAALGNWFDEEPVALPIELASGALSEALPALLAALGEQLPTDQAPPTVASAQPVDELILELRDPQMVTQAGQRRARATATLVYTPADPAQRPVESRAFLFTAPLGPIELEEMRWYLEEYFRWPIGVFQQRAQATEQALPGWGQAIYNAALGTNAATAARHGWRNPAGNAPRRVSIKVERELPEGTDATAQATAQADADEAASRLLALPWELLHDEGGYLLHGRYASHIRRQLPNRKPQARQLAALPVRILLVSPRPEDAGVAYIDHRSSALPLVQAVENLGELVTLTVLTPPTLAALEAELAEAAKANQPYAVVHFDGHGVYDRQQGLGALLFEAAPARGASSTPVHAPAKMDLVYADQMAAVVRNYGIPLVFLEACQTAQVENDPTASVAGRLLEEGVTSVVAMHQSVLVETAQRFVQAFYEALAGGGRVGEAMLAGQTALKHDPYRGKVMGAGELRLQDWFVPVLYQEQPDPQLFAALPSAAATRLLAQRRTLALGALPATPAHTFVGRSHELLQLERLLATQPYAVIRGPGGVGKTTIAVELARWLLRTDRCRRVAFVSLEAHGSAPAILDSLGRQLLPDGDRYTVAQFPDLKRALQPVERALADQPTLIVIDNVESVLVIGDWVIGNLADASSDPVPPTPHLPITQSPITQSILTLCQSLLATAPTTRILFTSRERLPAPFDAGAAYVALGALRRAEAVQLVERVMANENWTPPASDAGDTPQAVAELVEAVGCHARALVLLAREVARQGVRATTATVQQLLAGLEAKHPGQRANSLYASVELSLRRFGKLTSSRLPPEVREKVQGLAVFHGGGRLEVLAHVMEVDTDTADAIAVALIEVGLAEQMGYRYLRLDPALPTYLLGSLPAAVVESLRQRWGEAMIALVRFLYGQKFKDAQLAAQLTLLDLPNLRALLTWLPTHAPPEQVVAVAGRIEQLLANLGQPTALARAVAVRETAAKALGGWSGAHFENERLRIERLLNAGDLPTAYRAAAALRQRTLATGEAAYAGAAYDIAGAHWLLGRVLKRGSQARAALTPLGEAQRRFETLAAAGNTSAAHMAAAAIAEQADCLSAEGQLDAAAAAYEKAIKLAETQDDIRQVAVGKGQLATVRMLQQRYTEALAAYQEARTIFERLGEPGGVATAWHQIGMVHKRVSDVDAAERAYRQSLAIEVQQGNCAGQAGSLTELGNLSNQIGRLEEAVIFYRQAADLYVALGDQAGEGRQRNNSAATLVKLGRYDAAREEIVRAIECDKPFGHAAQPWKTWAILHAIERARGDEVAAQAAWQQARTRYLAYRRAGGYAQSGTGALCDTLLQYLPTSDTQGAASFLSQAQSAGWSAALLEKLEAVVGGVRDLALGDDPALNYSNAAEVLWLIERLGGETTAD